MVSCLLIYEFCAEKLGKITLELPEDIDEMLEEKAKRDAEKALLDKERKRAYNKKKWEVKDIRPCRKNL